MSGGARRLGTVLALAWHGVRRRPLTSVLTSLSVALGIGLVVAVDTVRDSTRRSFEDTARGYDLLLGPPAASPLETVLATLFHVEAPGGTLPWSVYEEMRADPRVEVAVPYAIGDTYRGHHVIGTDPVLFDTLRDAERRPIGEGVRGRMMGADGFEAVVGSAAARATGLKVGDTFHVSHGFVESAHAAHAETWRVVGVLRPTGMPHDRAIYIPITSFYAVAGHGAAPPDGGAGADAHGHDEDADAHDHDADEPHDHADPADEDEPHEHAEPADEGGGHGAPAALSAIGIRLKSPGLRLTFLQAFRTGRGDAQAILPTDQVRKLMTIVGDVDRGVRLVAWLVAVVAAVGILVGLYNTIQGRRREIALLRVLGARPRHVFGVILLEAMLLCLLGGVMGLVLGYGGVTAAGPHLLERFGVRVRVAPEPADLGLLAALAGLGLLAGALPAWRGLRTPVAENLEPRDG